MWGWEGGNLYSLYPISTFVCFESEKERIPRMQFFVTNPRKGHTKIIRNIPITTDKLIYEIVINSVIFQIIEIYKRLVDMEKDNLPF